MTTYRDAPHLKTELPKIFKVLTFWQALAIPMLALCEIETSTELVFGIKGLEYDPTFP